MVMPPAAPQHPRTRSLHGQDVTDEFAWMVDGGDDLTAYLRAEREYHDAALAPLTAVHKRLFTEMVARTPLADVGAESWAGGWHVRDLTPEGAQLGQFQRRDQSGAWTAVIDLDAVASQAGSTYAEYGLREVSPDGSLVAWSVDTRGDELYALRFREVASGRDRPDLIEGTYYSGGWSADGRTFFYTRVDHVHRPHQVWRHVVGSDPAQDVLVLQEDDRRFDLSVRASRCGRWILIHAASRDSAESWAIPADDAAAVPVSVGGRRSGHEYFVESVPEGPRPFLAVTNHAGAREFTLSWVALGDHDPMAWRSAVDAPLPGDPDHPDAGEVLGEGAGGGQGGAVPQAGGLGGAVGGARRPERRIIDVDGFAGHVVVTLREAGEPALYLVPVDSRGLDWEQTTAWRPAAGGTIELAANERHDAGFVTVVAQGRVAPAVWYDIPIDLEGDPVVRHRAEAPNHDPSAYTVRRQWVTVRDGTRVPVTIVSHRVTPLDGSAPCLLYGYGAYEIVAEPRFSRALPSLLDRGVVYAHAHVRGGGELGRWWWDQGHLAAKANSFRDFVDVARALGTGPRAVVDGARIVARGGSAGGLLVAAAMDLDPEAFAGIVAEVPFVDVVNSMLDAELPLTVGEWEEWGDPAVPEEYGWLAGYAPYENVPPASRRPFILATGAVNDPRVLVHEPAKWVARLRATDPQAGAVQRPGQRGGVLFRVTVDEGSHGGAAGRYAALEEEAATQAVVLAVMGIAG